METTYQAGERVKVIASTGMVHAGTVQADGTVLTKCGATFAVADATHYDCTCRCCWDAMSLPHEAFEAHPTPRNADGTPRPTPLSRREALDIIIGAVMSQRPGGRPHGGSRIEWPTRTRVKAL